MSATLASKSVEYTGKPLEYQHFVIGLERLDNILPEIRAMYLVHWAETEVLYLTRQPSIDHERLRDLDVMGKCCQFTVRDMRGNLSGNLCYTLNTSTHFKGMKMATEVAFYLLPDARKGRLALKVVQYAEDMLKSRGVKLIGMSDKSPCGGKSLAKLMDKMDYKPVSLNYIKEV